MKETLLDGAFRELFPEVEGTTLSIPLDIVLAGESSLATVWIGLLDWRPRDFFCVDAVLFSELSINSLDSATGGTVSIGFLPYITNIARIITSV